MKRSSSMPAQMDSSLPASQPATMESAPTATPSGSAMAPVVAISRDSAQGGQWSNMTEKGPSWETTDKKTGSDWEATDRKEGQSAA